MHHMKDENFQWSRMSVEWIGLNLGWKEYTVQHIRGTFDLGHLTFDIFRTALVPQMLPFQGNFCLLKVPLLVNIKIFPVTLNILCLNILCLETFRPKIYGKINIWSILKTNGRTLKMDEVSVICQIVKKRVKASEAVCFKLRSVLCLPNNHFEVNC